MLNVVEMLPNLTYLEITIQDRLENISLMETNIRKLKSHRGDPQRQHLIIECLRVVIMAIKYPSDITSAENKNTNDLLNNPKFLCRSYAELIIEQMVDEVLAVEHIVDIINYFNKIIPIGELEVNPPSNCPKIHRLINIDTLMSHCMESVRANHKESVVKIHELVDGISNGAYARVGANIHSDSRRLITNGYCSRMTIKKRYKYTKQLIKMLRTCPITDIPLLLDRIVVERFRLHCMTLVMPVIPLYLRNILEPHMTLIDKTDFMMEILYYFDSEYIISSDMYIDILDILKYYNYLVDSKLVYPGFYHPHVGLSYIAKDWFGSTSELIEYVKMQFRVDTINELIS
jgi:hypothetical protein